LEEYVSVRDLKPSTISVYRRVITRSLKEWLHLPVVDITKTMVEDKHRLMSSGISKKGFPGKAYANLCFKTLQSLLNYAAEKFEVDGKPLIAVNPVSRLTRTRAWHRIHPRTGVIPEYKMEAWYKAVDGLASKGVRDYFLLLLFSGLRRNEGACLKWSEIDFEARTLTIKRSQAKNHRDHVLPLSKFLFDLLSDRHATRSSSPYVFPGRGGKSHLTDFRFWMMQIRAKSGCNFMIHDTRRSFLTAGERLEVPYYVLKRLANHNVSGDTLIPYIVVSIERLREHMERITAHFLELMGIREKMMSAGATNILQAAV
jgi:integrase